MGTWLQSNPFAYPLLEALHVFGLALLVGNVALVELRVWGRGAELPLRPLARLALRLALAGFGIVAVSGLLMFSTRPAELLVNRAFQVKIALVAIAGANALWFHRRDGLGRADGLARAQTALSVGLWLAVIICGRWIAYA